jgi:hypothetical protein
MSDSNPDAKDTVADWMETISKETKPDANPVSISQSTVVAASTEQLPTLEKGTIDKLISIRQNLSLTKIKASKSLLDILNLCSSLVSLVMEFLMTSKRRLKISFVM